MLVILISAHPDYYHCGNPYRGANRTQCRSAFARFNRLPREFLQNFSDCFFRNFGFRDRRPRSVVAIRIADGCRVVLDVAVKVEALWVPEMRVRHVCGSRRPIGRHKPTEAGAVVSGTEHIEAGLRIAFFAGELVTVGITAAGISDSSKRIIIRLLLNVGWKSSNGRYRWGDPHA